jgi:uncharacterized protein with HEPN domain
MADIVASCGLIRSYTEGMTFDDFAADRKTVDAVARNLEIIGEAAKNLPDEILGESEVPWKSVRRFRDKIAHHYFDINLERLWMIIEEDIELLEETVRVLLAKQLKIEGLD